MAGETQEYQRCEVCGRTILRGERTRLYVTPGGERVTVCPLCVSRAEALDWIPAEVAAEGISPEARRRRGGIALRARLGRVAERARGAAEERRRPPPEPPAADRATGQPPGASPETAPQAPPEPRPKPRRRSSGQRPAKRRAGGGAARPAAAAPRRRVPRTPEGIVRRGIERFNESEEVRKVAGLFRSLGEPSVSVQAKDGAALVTIAWELSWYQWEVDVGERGLVREVAKGAEVGELDAEAQRWNATAAEDGTLRLRR